jgi:hypothetical protein
MMKLTLLPQFGADKDIETVLSVSGETLTIDGTAYDLSDAPKSYPGTRLMGEVVRVDGIIHATVRVTLGPTADPNQPSDAEFWTVEAVEGDIPLPALRLDTEKPPAQEPYDDDAL